MRSLNQLYSALRVGDRLRLVRLVWRNDEKSLQCCRLVDRRLVGLPLSCASLQFTEDPGGTDDRGLLMSFNDLSDPASVFTLTRRPRRVQLIHQVSPLNVYFL